MQNGSSIPPEIESKLIVSAVAELPRFESLITGEQLEKFPEHDRPVLLAMSKIQQQGVFTHSELIKFSESVRAGEAWLRGWCEMAKKAFYWTVALIITSAVTAIFLRVFKVI